MYAGETAWDHFRISVLCSVVRNLKECFPSARRKNWVWSFVYVVAIYNLDTLLLRVLISVVSGLPGGKRKFLRFYYLPGPTIPSTSIKETTTGWACAIYQGGDYMSSCGEIVHNDDGSYVFI